MDDSQDDRIKSRLIANILFYRNHCKEQSTNGNTLMILLITCKSMLIILYSYKLAQIKNQYILKAISDFHLNVLIDIRRRFKVFSYNQPKSILY